jgi:glucokinase
MRLGIDIGGTSAKLGVVDANGAIRARSNVPTGPDLKPEALVEQLAAALGRLTAEWPVTGLGVAAPGFRAPSGEGVVNVTNLPLIDGFHLRTALRRSTGLPVQVDNDANAAAMGEHRYGAGREAGRLLVVTLGTGIGAGMVIDGAVHRIAWGGLGDPGHVTVEVGGPLCGCGAHGCAETLAAVPGIVRRANISCPGRRLETIGEVIAAAEVDPAVRASLEVSASYFAAALTTYVHLLAPDRVLLGGGGMDAGGPLLCGLIEERFRATVQPFLAERLTLGRAALGNDAGVIGAAALFDGA